MKKFNLIFLVILTVFSLSEVKAQQNEPPADAPNQTGERVRRADLLAELGLTPAQTRQFRRINADNRPAMRAAQQRLKEANSALDQAVYADAADEAAIQSRIKEAQAAQADVIRIRTQAELAVRRILTAEQLLKFREARRRFEAANEDRRTQKRQNRMLNAPNRRFGNRRQRTSVPPNN